MAADPTAPIGFMLNAAADLDFDLLTGMSTVAGLDAVVQAISSACGLFKGEWFLDLEAGIPYFEDVLGQTYSQQTVLTIFRKQILKVPHVLQILEISSVFDSATRVLAVTFEVSTEFGTAQGEVTL